MREGAGVDRVAAEDRAERQGGAVALGRGSSSSAVGDQLGAAQRGHPRDRVGEGRVEGVGAVGEGVHRAGAQRAARAGWSSPRGRRSPAPGGPAPRPGPRRRRAGGGCRSSRRPRSSSGSPPRAAPVTAAIALAVSITRPPPRATRLARAGPVEQRGGGLGHLRRPGPACDGSAARLASSGAAGQARAVREQLERLEAVLGEQLRAPAASPSPRKTTVRPASRQTKLPLTRPRRCAG